MTVLLGPWVFIPACGDPAPHVSNDGCADLAASYCARLDRCAPFLVPFFFGDDAACVGYMTRECGISLAAPGSGLTSAIASACGREIGALSCDQFLASAPTVPSCVPHGGATQLGGPCIDDWQCGSALCSIRYGTGCGLCIEPIQEGGECTGPDCALGLVCAFDTATRTTRCAAPFASGAACDDSRPCRGNELCQRESANSPLGTCQPGRQPGESCQDGVINCDYLQNAQCNTATNVCELPVATVQPSELCGWIDGDYYFCNGACSVASASDASGTCTRLEPRILAGGRCDAGGNCELGASCVDGVCAFRDPSLCGGG